MLKKANVEQSCEKTTENRVILGKVTSAHGVLGWNKIYSWTQPVHNIFLYPKWLLKLSDNTFKEVTNEQTRCKGKILYARFKNCSDRNKAEEFVNAEIFVDKKELATLDHDEYYWHELEGLTVLLKNQNQDYVNIGEIAYMLDTGANDVMVVKPTAESLDNKERLIPWIQTVILQVDLKKQLVNASWNPDF